MTNEKLAYIVGILIIVIVLIYLFSGCPKHVNAPVKPEEGYNYVSNNQVPKNQRIGKMVLYYSDSCVHCKMFMPTWDKFEQYARSNISGLSVKKIKCEGAGEQICFQQGVQGYPTVIMYPLDGRRLVFDKNRTIDDLVKFVNENRK